MLPVFATALLAAAAVLPPECEPPELHDVLPLKQLAQLDGALSVGLDSVATWCFDPGGTWTGGVQASPMKGKSKASAEPIGDCAKAVASCEAALKAVDKPPLRELATKALADLDRPYRTAHYAPKRSGLKDKPNEKADCHSRERSELFGEAQSRMDLARLISQIQSEYANYKAWLVQEGMRCRGEVFTAKKSKDNTRVAVAQDTPSKPEPAPAPAAAPRVASVEPAKPNPGEPPPAAWVTERETALAKPMLEKWRYLSDQTAKQETDRDYTLGFLASRELRACDCTRVNPQAIVRSLEKKSGSQSLLESEDPANTKCTVCALDAFTAWKPRADKQCKQMDELTDYELSRLEKTDDANGIPPRCFDDTRTKRAAAAAKKAAEDAAKAKATADAVAAAQSAALVAAQARFDAGRPVAAAVAAPDAGVRPVAALPAQPDARAHPPVATAGQAAQAPVAQTAVQPPPAAVATPAVADAGAAIATGPSANPNLVTVNGMTYYRPSGAAQPAPGSTPAAPAPMPSPAPGAQTYPTTGMTGPGMPAATGNGYDSFVPPEAWAPIPSREDGRMYVRLSMSAACVAEIMPGPIQARTGDLLLVPYGAQHLAVKSPCGGLAEIYWGKEAKPRYSEVFGRNQPIKFEFKAQ